MIKVSYHSHIMVRFFYIICSLEKGRNVVAFKSSKLSVAKYWVRTALENLCLVKQKRKRKFNSAISPFERTDRKEWGNLPTQNT